MPTERDPRTDPRPGDVLELGSVTYRVIDRWKDFIHYETDHPLGSGWDNMIADQWRRDMARAEVVHHGD
jgi:hypothetical protein